MKSVDSYDAIRSGRSFLKSAVVCEADDLSASSGRHLAKAPDWQKAAPATARIYELPPPQAASLGQKPFAQVVQQRRSMRQFASTPLRLEQLSFLLWAVQGAHPEKIPGPPGSPRRMVASAGGCHPFETYLAIQRVDGLPPGLYRYLASSHSLAFLYQPEDLPLRLCRVSYQQAFVANAPVCFVWSVLPERTERHYQEASHKVIALDLGQVCHALYLAAEACDLGSCAVGAYDQSELDEFLRLDGEDEFSILMAPVGFPMEISPPPQS